MAIRVNIVCIVLMHRGLFETGHDSWLSSLSRRGPKAIPGAEPAGPTGGTGLSGSLMPSGAGCFAQTCSLPARPQAQAVGLGNEELQLRHPAAHGTSPAAPKGSGRGALGAAPPAPGTDKPSGFGAKPSASQSRRSPGPAGSHGKRFFSPKRLICKDLGAQHMRSTPLCFLPPCQPLAVPVQGLPTQGHRRLWGHRL